MEQGFRDAREDTNYSLHGVSRSVESIASKSSHEMFLLDPCLSQTGVQRGTCHPRSWKLFRLLIGGVPDRVVNRLTDFKIRDGPGDIEFLIGSQ